MSLDDLRSRDPNSLTRSERAAIARAADHEERERVRLAREAAARADAAERGKGSPRSSDDLPTVTARIRDNIAREVDSLLANSVGLDTSDRVKVLTAAARVTGFADSDDAGQPAPFVSRGFVQPAVVVPTGAEPWVCGTCGALHSPGGPVPVDARVTLEPESLRTTTDPVA